MSGKGQNNPWQEPLNQPKAPTERERNALHGLPRSRFSSKIAKSSYFLLNHPLLARLYITQFFNEQEDFFLVTTSFKFQKIGNWLNKCRQRTGARLKRTKRKRAARWSRPFSLIKKN